MKYRINRKTNDRIGLGSAYMCEAEMDEAITPVS